MNALETILYSILLLFFKNIAFGQEAEQTSVVQNQTPIFLSSNSVVYSSSQTAKSISYNLLNLNDTTTTNQNTKTYPPDHRDYKRLGINTSMYFGTTIIAFGILWAMPESVSNWDKQEIREKGFFYKWKQNVKAGPVWDHDDWKINYLAHPYCGGIYYMTARSSGFTIFESFLYSALMSTCFWEYGIEAFAEVPSTQDLIVTPVLGSVVGEAFFYAKKSILKHDHRVLNSKTLGYTTLFLIDPFNTLLDSFGYKEKVKAQMSAAPIGFDNATNKSVWGLNFNLQF